MTVFAGDYQAASETKQFTLGQEIAVVDPINGPQIWRYINNGNGSALAEGDIVALKADETVPGVVVKSPTSSPTARLAGVAQYAIPDGYYGFVLRDGVGNVLADTGGVTISTALVTGNAVAGRADNFSAGAEHQVMGWCLATATATNKAKTLIKIP